MVHNFVKYLVQTRLHLWDIKRTNFKPEKCLDDLLEICYFYISQTKSSLDKIFYKVVYYYIIYMFVFWGEFIWLFCRDLHGFSWSCGLHKICSQLTHLLVMMLRNANKYSGIATRDDIGYRFTRLFVISPSPPLPTWPPDPTLLLGMLTSNSSRVS